MHPTTLSFDPHNNHLWKCKKKMKAGWVYKATDMAARDLKRSINQWQPLDNLSEQVK